MEESKEPAQPATMMINTSGPAVADKGDAGDELKATDAKDDNDYEQEALNYLSLALQLIGDFSADSGALSGEKSDRKKLIAFLEIDTLLSRVSLATHASD